MTPSRHRPEAGPPAAESAPGSRVAWLDGLRGIAAVQVVLLHYASAFLPGLGLMRPELVRHGWEQVVVDTPLFFVLNGHASVSLFFLVSGAALTFSFARQPLAIWQGAVRRVVRLGVPMAAAILLGAALVALWPASRVEAGALTGSAAWLGAASPLSPTPGRVLHQVLLEGMLAGYSGMSLLPAPLAAPLALDGLADSFNPPLWTLHLELVGSLLVLGLVAVRALVPRRLHLAGCVVLAAAFAASPMAMFVVGHLAAPRLARPGSSAAGRAAGLACLAGGIVLCTGRGFGPVAALLSRLPRPDLAFDLLHFQGMLGEVLVFAGVALLPAARRWLAGPAARRIGALSFSLYLVHVPLLLTVVSALFLRLQGRAPYEAVVAACLVAGIGLSFLAALVFERWVDRPAIRLSRALLRRRMPGAA